MKSLIKKYPVLFIAVLALLVRVLLFLFIPVPDQSGGDFYFYENLAKSLLQGKGFDGEMYVAPGYSFFLMILYFITGSSSMAAVSIGQTILGVLIAIATYIFTKQLFSFRTAILAGAMMAIWPTALLAMFHFGNGLLLYTVLLSFSVITFLESLKSQSFIYAGLSGFLLALAALTDPVALYLPIAFFFLWVFITYREVQKRQHFFRNIIFIFIFLSVFILSLLPWSYRNSVVFSDTGQAPFISKQIEKDFLEKKHFSSISQTFSASKLSLLLSGVQKMFLIPPYVSNLDTGTSVIYKDIALSLVTGQYVDLSKREFYILGIKVVLYVMHWSLLLLALVGLFLTRNKYFTILFVFMLGYITFAAIGYGSLSNYQRISPLSEFFFPFLPFMIIFTSYVLIEYFLPMVKLIKSTVGNHE